MHKSIRTRLWVGIVSFIAIVAFFYPFVIPPDVTYIPEETVYAPSEPVPDFSQHKRVIDKKKAFFNYLKPEVEKQNREILIQRSVLVMLRERINNHRDITASERLSLNNLCKIYAVKCGNLSDDVFLQLLKKVDIIPVELVLVQAANESAWGTSRFARQGYNFFGLWCFRKGCGFVPRRRDEGTNHEVAKFGSLSEGVSKYLNNLNRHAAYEELRVIRSVLRNNQQSITASALIEGLLSYSERGQAYIEELHAMIRVNRKYM